MFRFVISAYGGHLSLFRNFHIIKHLSRLTLFVALVFATAVQAQRIHVNPDTRMKAVFLMNFTRYISWTTLDSAKTFTVGVYGLDDILLPLRQLARERKTSGQTIRVEKAETHEEIEGCDILFVPVSQAEAFHKLRPEYPGKNILYVGESLGFATSDGAINFVKREGKIKLEINRKALKEANLVASSQLLKLAELVGEDGEVIINE